MPLQALAQRILPRILTQVCRDPGSPLFGCFDRNWWHYKIRDFPSIILQQGGYALALAAADRPEEAAPLRRIAAGACRFWAERALRPGAFEEYYPWEQGYPPLAFGTLAALKTADLLGDPPADVLRPACAVAARQLIGRFEPRAANQQVAGLAALAWIRKLFPELVSPEVFESVAARTLALQHAEGWYMEYDGPDLGYLSVTLDCLWDLFDVTGDARFRESAERALGFMHPFVVALGGGIGMHNARNTDYIVPYGLARFFAAGGENAGLAGDLLAALYPGAESADSIFAAIDDRYLCHYIGHSIFRAAQVLRAAGTPWPVTRPAETPERFWEGSGHWLSGRGGCAALVSLKKGGIVTLRGPGGGYACDFGWVVDLPDGTQHVSHWWSPLWDVRLEGGCAEIAGSLFPHREQISTPWKHIALRLCVRVAGRRVIGWLKDRLIFKKRAGSIGFRRAIRIGETIEITDEFSGLPAGVEPRRAPRASKRHVASADSFHAEDLVPVMGYRREETIERAPGSLRIVTRLAMEP